MAKYRITAPDGHSYSVTAPDDATEEQVLAYAQQNYTMAGRPKQTRLSKPSGPKAQGDDFLTRTKDQYGRYWAGVGKSMVDTGRGVRQYAVDVAADPTNALGPLGRPALRAAIGKQVDSLAAASPALQSVRQYQRQLRNEEAERRELLPSFSEDPVFAAGNIMGTLGQIVGPGAAARGTMASRALLPRTVGGNALQGGAIGTVQPIAEEGERGVNAGLGTLFGGVGAAIPKVIGAATRPMRSAVSSLLGHPTATGVERAAGREIVARAADPSALMAPQPSSVPGVVRTLGEETQDAGIAGLENMLRGRVPGQFGPQDLANNAARLRVLQGIAGTEGDMQAAIAARQQASSSAREAAVAAPPAEVAATLQALDDAIANARGRTAVQPALKSLRDRLSSYADEGGRIDVNTLDNVRQDIGDMLAGKFGGENAAALAGSRELIGVRDSLNSEVGAQVPAFTDYLNAYRAGSAPINRMEIGREILSRGSSSIPDTLGNEALQPGRLFSATNDLDGLAARATGFSKAKASDFMSPDDIGSLRAIQDDMRRVAARGSSPMVGSRTDANQQMGRQVARGALSIVPGVGRFSEWLEQRGSQQLQEKMAYLVANPAEYRRVAAALSKEDRAVLSKALFNLSARTGVSVPALAE